MLRLGRQLGRLYIVVVIKKIGSKIATRNEQKKTRVGIVFALATVIRWLQLRFDFDSTAIRWAFDCLSKVIKMTVTQQLAEVMLTYLFIYVQCSSHWLAAVGS